MSGINIGILEGLIRLRDELTPAIIQAGKSVQKFAQDQEAGLKRGAEALGLTIKAGTAAVGLLVAGMTLAVNSMLSTADAVSNLQAETGVTAAALQELSFAGGAVGLTMADSADAITKMSRSLVAQSDDTVAAISRLGLSMDKLTQQAPDKSLQDILVALQQIPNPMERSALAMELLGKSGAKMIPLGEGLEAARQRAHELGVVMSDESIAAADALGDSMDELGKVTGGFVNHLGDVVTSSQAAADFVDGLKGIIGGLTQAVIENKDFLQSLITGGLSIFGEALAAVMVLVTGSIMAVGNLTKSYYSIESALIGVIKAYYQWKLLLAEVRGDDAAVKSAATMIDSLERQQKELDGLGDKYQGQFEKISDATAIAAVKLHDLAGALHGGSVKMDEIGEKADKTSKKIGLTAAAAKALAAEMKANSEAFAASAKEWEKYYDTLIDEAVKKAAKGQDDIRSSIEERMRASAAAYVKYAEKAAKDYAASFQGTLKSAFHDLPQTILSAIQGGGDVLKSVGAMFGSKVFGEGSKLVTDMTSWLTKGLGKTIGGALGAIVPGLGTLLGSGIGSIAGKIFGSIFGGEAKKVMGMRQDFIEAAGGIGELERKAAEAGISLDKLLNTKKVADFNDAVKQLQDAFQLHDQAVEDVNAAMKKYGLTIDEMGPKWARQELDKKAMELLKDYELLSAAGADQTAIIEHMGPALNEYVQDCLKAGIAIPENLRPALQKMAEMGELTDANGEKITDVSKLNFTKDLTTQVQDLVQSIKDLVNALLGIPKSIDTQINVGTNTNAGANQYLPPSMGGTSPYSTAPSQADIDRMRNEHHAGGGAGAGGGQAPAAGGGAVPLQVNLHLNGIQVGSAMTTLMQQGYIQVPK